MSESPARSGALEPESLAPESLEPESLEPEAPEPESPEPESPEPEPAAPPPVADSTPAAADSRPARRGRRAAGQVLAGVSADPAVGIRELAIAAAVLVALSRFLEGPLIWPVAGLVLAATFVAALQVLGEAEPTGSSLGVPVESLLLPAVAAAAAVGVIRLVPVGPLLVAAAVVVAVAIARAATTESRLLAASRSPTVAERQGLVLEVLVVAFAGFVGVAALVPGGLPDPGAPDPIPLGPGSFALVAFGDAVVAGLLGYRAAALRALDLRSALWSAATYAAVVAIGAAAIRAIGLPRILGPALLTLVFYLWDTYHGTPPIRRRDPRWIWQTVLLLVLAIVFIAWNQRLGD